MLSIRSFITEQHILFRHFDQREKSPRIGKNSWKCLKNFSSLRSGEEKFLFAALIEMTKKVAMFVSNAFLNIEQLRVSKLKFNATLMGNWYNMQLR